MSRVKRITFIASLVGMFITAITFAGCSHEVQVEDILDNNDTPYPLVSSCPLAVYLDQPQITTNEPVPSEPVIVTGWVNKPPAIVTVNGVAVQVNS